MNCENQILNNQQNDNHRLQIKKVKWNPFHLFCCLKNNEEDSL